VVFEDGVKRETNCRSLLEFLVFQNFTSFILFT